MLAEIIAADLNGDWAISRDEMLAALNSGAEGGLAELFLKGDQDANLVRDFAEIKVILQENAAKRASDPEWSRPLNLAGLIDFDDDGQVTRQELLWAWSAVRVRPQ